MRSKYDNYKEDTRFNGNGHRDTSKDQGHGTPGTVYIPDDPDNLPTPKRFSRLMNRLLIVLGAFLLILIPVLFISNQYFGRPEQGLSTDRSTVNTAANSASTDTDIQPADAGSAAADDSAFSHLFETGEQPAAEIEGWAKRLGTLIFRLSLAALLAAMLAFRPHKSIPILHRNPYVAQTQILLAVVAAALMMIVSDNAARAFGIFAAASVVRFRTNIRDPKEITVLLINLGIGLAAGVGRWELAIIFGLFVLLLLWILEHQEPEQVLRAMELKVRTHQVEVTDQALRAVFESNDLKVEVREHERESEENLLGKIVYRMDMNSSLSIERLSEEVFSSDADNIDSIAWHQKKTSSYIYR